MENQEIDPVKVILIISSVMFGLIFVTAIFAKTIISVFS